MNHFWTLPIYFGRDHFILVETKSLWSSPNQFGQTKTILDRPKLFWSHRKTRHTYFLFYILTRSTGTDHGSERYGVHYRTDRAGIARVQFDTWIFAFVIQTSQAWKEIIGKKLIIFVLISLGNFI